MFTQFTFSSRWLALSRVRCVFNAAHRSNGTQHIQPPQRCASRYNVRVSYMGNVAITYHHMSRTRATRAVLYR